MAPQFRLHVAPQGDVLAAAEDCELDVFAQVYNESRDLWHEEWSPYDPYSLFLVVTEGGGDAVATMRILLPGPLPLKTLSDTAKSPWFVDGFRAARALGMDLDRTWDVATLAMRRHIRSSQVPIALYHGLFHAARFNEARWIVTILDSRVRRLLNMLNIRMQALPGTAAMPYYGSESSAPLWGDLTTMADWQRRNAPEAYRLVNLGVGLSHVSLPTPTDYQVDRLLLHPTAV